MASGLNNQPDQFAVNPYLLPLSFDPQGGVPFWMQMWQQTQPNLGLDTSQATGLSSLLGGGGLVNRGTSPTTPTTPTSPTTPTQPTTPTDPTSPTTPTTPTDPTQPTDPNDPSRFVGLYVPGVPGFSNPGVGVPGPNNPAMPEQPPPANPYLTAPRDANGNIIDPAWWAMTHPGQPYTR